MIDNASLNKILLLLIQIENKLLQEKAQHGKTKYSGKKPFLVGAYFSDGPQKFITF